MYFRCTLKNFQYNFLKNLSWANFKNTSLLLNSKSVYYFVLHMKFSSLFSFAQLTDMFAYEVPQYSLKIKRKNLTSVPKTHKAIRNFNKYTTSSIVVYNFHMLYNQERVYLFSRSACYSSCFGAMHFNTLSRSVTSITDLFYAANWLEREISELSGVIFSAKKDLRNLMLQYGDSTAPFQKAFPTIGLREFFYNPVKDSIIQNPVSIQV